MLGLKSPSLFWINVLNLVPNVFWSGLCLAPVYVFWCRVGLSRWLYGFGAISLLPYALPASFVAFLQLSSDPALYRRLRVPWVNHLTQHGTLVRRLLPHHRPLVSLQALEKATYVREQFHLALFLFFMLSVFYAAAQGKPGWALLLLLLNVVYNVYPIWLQQYVRLRLYRLRLRLDHRR